MTKEQKYDLLTNQNVKKVVCKMAVPTIISMLITSLYNIPQSLLEEVESESENLLLEDKSENLNGVLAND